MFNPSPDIPVLNMYELSSDRVENGRFYSGKLWRKVRAVFLATNPLCAKCGKLATVVDHVIPRKCLPPEKWYDFDNLQSLDAVCHNKKRVEERGLKPYRKVEDEGQVD